MQPIEALRHDGDHCADLTWSFNGTRFFLLILFMLSVCSRLHYISRTSFVPPSVRFRPGTDWEAQNSGKSKSIYCQSYKMNTISSPPVRDMKTMCVSKYQLLTMPTWRCGVSDRRRCSAAVHRPCDGLRPASLHRSSSPSQPLSPLNIEKETDIQPEGANPRLWEFHHTEHRKSLLYIEHKRSGNPQPFSTVHHRVRVRLKPPSRQRSLASVGYP
jgi:hypothetical protein